MSKVPAPVMAFDDGLGPDPTRHRPNAMRKINTRDFRLATRGTVREVNRQIVLNLIREHQPISRAELARRMRVNRAALTAIVHDLVVTGEVDERGTATTARGRRPTLLHVRTTGRLAVVVDVRPGNTSVALADFAGHTIARHTFATPASSADLADELGVCVTRLFDSSATDAKAEEIRAQCQGVGLVVPGMVDRRSGRVIYAPRLGWRDVDLRDALTKKLALPVYVESAPIACALARLWLSPEDTRSVHSFAYVSVSDGVGVGLVIDGDVLRGTAHTAGEFGHVTLDPSGPVCACGQRGCWEAYACNSATVARYVERVFGPRQADPLAEPRDRRTPSIAIEEIVRRARRGEPAARGAIADTGHQIGRGLAAVVNAFNPGRIFVGGEITAAWELLEQPMRAALVERTITQAARETPIVADRNPAEYRLLGAVAIVAAPTFAAPRVG